MSDWTVLVGSGVPALLSVVLDAALKGSLLIALAGAAAVALHREGAATRHLIWATAFVGLLLLPALSAAVPRWRLTLPARPAVAAVFLAESIPAPEPEPSMAPAPRDGVEVPLVPP